METEKNPDLKAVGLARRLGIILYEILLLAATLMAASLPPVILVGEAINQISLCQQLYRLYLLVIIATYFIYFWQRGQTLPMKVWKTHLITKNGRSPTIRHCLLRWLLAWSLLLIIPLFPAIAKKPLWHERRSGTFLAYRK